MYIQNHRMVGVGYCVVNDGSPFMARGGGIFSENLVMWSPEHLM